MSRSRQRLLAELCLVSAVLAFTLSTLCICYPAYARALARLASVTTTAAHADLRIVRDGDLGGEKSDRALGITGSSTCSATLGRYYLSGGPVDVSKIPHVSTCTRCCVCEPELTEALAVRRFHAGGGHQAVVESLFGITVPDSHQQGENIQAVAKATTVIRRRFRTGLTPPRRQSSGLSEDGDPVSASAAAPVILRPAAFVTAPIGGKQDRVETLCPLCRGCTHVLTAPQPFYVGFNMTFKALPHSRQGIETYWACPTRVSPDLCESDEGIQISIWACNAESTVGGKSAATSLASDGCPAAAQRALVSSLTQARERILAAICAGSAGLQASSAGCISSQLFPPTWLEHVDAVLPDRGKRIRGHVMASNLPRGLPLSRLMNHPWPWVPLSVVRRMDSEHLLTAAVLDVLLLNCNRGLDDITVEEEGSSDGAVSFQLHNNMHLFGATAGGRRCLTNSIFIPTSQSFKIATLGLQFVSNTSPLRPKSDPHPAQMLDYRCHIPISATPSNSSDVVATGEQLGTNYPTGIAALLSWVRQSSVEAVADAYGIEDVEVARRLRRRAKDMLRRGFEWTILHGERATARSVPAEASLSEHNTNGTGIKDNSSSFRGSGGSSGQSDGRSITGRRTEQSVGNDESVGEMMSQWPEKCCDVVYDARDGRLMCSSSSSSNGTSSS